MLDLCFNGTNILEHASIAISMILSGVVEGKGGGPGLGFALDLLPPALITQSDGTFEVKSR